MKHIKKAALSALLTCVYSFSIMVTAPVSVGELIDKITILQIKSERIKDLKKLMHINNELKQLQETCEKYVLTSEELLDLTQHLKSINEKLWDIEDAIRDKESNQSFDQEFIQLARAVYFTNDKRCAVKRKINELSGSTLFEEKSYKEYRKDNLLNYTA